MFGLPVFAIGRAGWLHRGRGATTAWDTARPGQPLPRTEFCAVHGYIFGWQLVVITGPVWDLLWDYNVYTDLSIWTLHSEFAIPFPW